MLTMDMLPRVMPDFYCERFAEAVEEVVRRQEALSTESAITRFEESPFGGYVVYSVSAEAFAAALDDEVLSPSPGDLIMPSLGLQNQDGLGRDMCRPGASRDTPLGSVPR